MEHCTNIPAFDGGAAILAAINAMRIAMETRMDTMEHRLITALSSSDFNNVARLANSRLAAPTDLLHPLHVAATGQPIPNFPATSAALSALTGPTLTAILRALGADVGGTVQEKKRRLRAYVGLRPTPA